MVSSKELRDCGSVVAGDWDSFWARVCGRRGDTVGLRAGKWAFLNWKADVVGFVTRSCRWCKKLSCLMLRTVGKTAQLSSSALDTFWSRAIGVFFSLPFLSGIRFIALDAPWGAYHRRWMSGQKIGSYRHKLGALVLFPLYDAVTCFFNL